MVVRRLRKERNSFEASYDRAWYYLKDLLDKKDKHATTCAKLNARIYDLECENATLKEGGEAINCDDSHIRRKLSIEQSEKEKFIELFAKSEAKLFKAEIEHRSLQEAHEKLCSEHDELKVKYEKINNK